MPELVFTVARFGVLIMLWAFVFAVARAVQRDVFGKTRTAGGRQRAPQSAGRGPSRGAGGGPAPKVARTLVVTGGDRAGVTLPLHNAPIRIGRAGDSTLVINDDFASSRHAQIVPRNGQWILEDLGSTNGTYLGRAKVTGPTPVPLGVPIRIGRTSIELRP